jgi:hypothetical protein
VYVGGFFWVASGQRNVKVRNVRNDPRVSLAIDGSAEAPMVAEGSADVIDLTEVGTDVTGAFREKHNGWDIRDISVDGPRIALRIHVTRWMLSG